MLALLFVVVPVVEIWVILRVGSLLGGLSTVGIIVVTAMVGAALARHQGFAALRQLQSAMARGEQIAGALVEAALVLAAGITLLTPGFVTDAIGLLLLLPPVRAPLAAALARWAERRALSGSGFVVMGGGRRRDREEDRAGDDEDPPPPGVIDV